MLASLYAKLIAVGMLLALLVAGYAYAHHKGAVSQKAADSVQIAQKDHELAAAGQSLDNAAAALRASSAATQANKDAAAAANLIADAAVKHAADAKQALAAANTAWQAKFKAAQGAKGCETLQEQLCPSVMSY